MLCLKSFCFYKNDVDSIEGMERMNFPMLEILWIGSQLIIKAHNKINRAGNLANVSFPCLKELGVRKNK